MKLSIVIPALDEEQAIRSIIERTLAARETIIEQTPVDQVEVIVVSDGSSDKTPEIAKEYVDRIKLISYRVNRGYGAAIKLGFENSSGDLVSFLDADGTCDPLFFVDLVNAMVDKNADIALGNRMTDRSEMPPVRRFGNRVFAFTINRIAATTINDSASGMRVIRRSSLDRIYPLPDGLHFTPAMSCRAALDEKLSMVEVGMTYAERTGESKLSAVKDGLRFARVIFDIALTYRPFRIFGSMGVLLMIAMGLFGTELVATYLQTGKVHDGMVFRVMAIIVLGATGFVAFSIGMLGERAAHLSHNITRPHGPLYRFFRSVISSPALFWTGAFFLAVAFLASAHPAWQYLTTGRIDVHWSQIGFSGFLFLFGVQILALSALDRIFATLLETERNAPAPHHDPEEIFGG
jgi:glycosyltransferase involved in cell wall biosynthesis